MRNLINAVDLIIIVLISLFSFVLYSNVRAEEVINDWYGSRNTGVSAVKFQQYNEVCGSCHFAYQPGLLPAISWKKLMSNKDSHFGKALKLLPVEIRTMSRYLVDNSAGHVNDDISYRVLKTMTYDPVIIQITETPFFMNTHRQLSDNGEIKATIKATGQCDNCHQRAAEGKY